MFAVRSHNQARKSVEGKPGRADSTLLGKNAAEHNPLWQSLVLRPTAIQPKLAISQPGDPYEQEADRVAEPMGHLTSPGIRQHSVMLGRTVAVGREQEKAGGNATRSPKPQENQKSKGAADVHATPSAVVAQARRGSRRPLPYRNELEDHFQRGLTNLETYFGPEAAESCASVGAQAFCAGNVLAFADTSPAFDVVAHEVAHSLQQGGDHEGLSRMPSNLEVTPEGGPAEREASEEAQAALRQRGTLSENNSPLSGEVSQAEGKPPSIHTLSEPGNMRGVALWKVMLARLPKPADCLTRLRGLSSIGPIVKETYDGTAATTIDDSIWPMGSWERRWQIYDATDTLVYESFYTMPKPTLVIPKELITGGTPGGEQRPWSVWIKVTKTMVPFGGDDPENFPHDYTTFPVYETAQDYAAAQQTKSQAGEDDEWVVRLPGLMPQPTPSGVMTSGGTKVTPQTALELIKNMTKGEPPFKPELGKGGCSWFVSEGTPYTGTASAKNVSIQAEIAKPADPITFDEGKLKAINQKVKAQFEPGAEAQFRQYHKIPPEKPLNARQRGGLLRFIKDAVESRMWDEVGEQVRESGAKVGEVILQNSEFSKSGNGKFLVVADASKIQIKGGMAAVVSALESAGSPVEPVVTEAAEAMAKRMKWAGRVRSVFRYGGRVLIVCAIAADVYKIYVAQDKTKAIITSVGGWAGASIGAGAFAAWWTPADTAGPWAWLGHGVGTLVSGGIGYWVGSESMRTIYELVIEE